MKVQERPEPLDEDEDHVEERASCDVMIQWESISPRREMLRVGRRRRLVVLEMGELLDSSKWLVGNEQELLVLEVGVVVRRQIRS